MQEEKETILVTTLYGGRTKKPIVQISMPAMDEDAPHYVRQLDVYEARSFACNLLQAAEAAIGDAFLMEFFQSELGLSEIMAVSTMAAFREFRKKYDKS